MLLDALHIEPVLSRANFHRFSATKDLYSLQATLAYSSFLVIWCDVGDTALCRLRRDQPGSPKPPCWQFRVHCWLSGSVVTWTDPKLLKPHVTSRPSDTVRHFDRFRTMRSRTMRSRITPCVWHVFVIFRPYEDRICIPFISLINMIWCDVQWSPDVQIAAGRILYHVEFFTLSDSTCHDVAQGSQSSGSELTDGSFHWHFPNVRPSMLRRQCRVFLPAPLQHCIKNLGCKIDIFSV